VLVQLTQKRNGWRDDLNKVQSRQPIVKQKADKVENTFNLAVAKTSHSYVYLSIGNRINQFTGKFYQRNMPSPPSPPQRAAGQKIK